MTRHDAAPASRIGALAGGASRQLGSAREGTRGPWLRSLAAVGFLAAGIIHLAQVALHLAEDVRFGAFFIIVGGLQLVAALALSRACRPRWYWLGIAGSVATIAIWLISRSLGLPFGAEPGSPEAIGSADAAASLLEGVTVVALLLWLHDRTPRTGLGAYGVAAGAVAALGVTWFLARGSGLFDPDSRLTGAPPELADRAALVVVGASLALVVGLSRPPTSRPGGIHRPLLRGLLVLVLLSSAALTVLTLPARGGQNAACQYGPLAEVSGLSHAEPPPNIELELGEVRTVSVLLLSVCGSEPLMMTAAEPVGGAGAAETLLGFSVPEAGSAASGSATGVDLLGAPAGALLRPGEVRELVAHIQATDPGIYRLDAVRLHLRGPSGEATMTFATFLVACTGPCPAVDGG